MNTYIEIHNNDTNESGTYDVWYKVNGETHKRKLSEAYVNSLLSMRQKEDFFMGKFKFGIKEYDFVRVLINGEKIPGLN